MQITGIDLSSFWLNDCSYYYENPRIKLTITSNIPGAVSTPVYIQDNQCAIIQ